MPNLHVVNVERPTEPLLTTKSITEAIAVCKDHPERGVLVRRRAGAHFLPIAHPRFDRRTLALAE